MPNSMCVSCCYFPELYMPIWERILYLSGIESCSKIAWKLSSSVLVKLAPISANLSASVKSPPTFAKLLNCSLYKGCMVNKSFNVLTTSIIVALIVSSWGYSLFLRWSIATLRGPSETYTNSSYEIQLPKIIVALYFKEEVRSIGLNLLICLVFVYKGR